MYNNSNNNCNKTPLINSTKEEHDCNQFVALLQVLGEQVILSGLLLMLLI